MKCKTLLTMSVPTTKWLGSEGRNLTLSVCVDPQNSLSLWERLQNKQQRRTHGFCETWMMAIPYTPLALPISSGEEQVYHTSSMISATTLLPISFSSIACLIISADPSFCFLILLSTMLNLLLNHSLVEIWKLQHCFEKCTKVQLPAGLMPRDKVISSWLMNPLDDSS